jgi:hypothetical protein
MPWIPSHSSQGKCQKSSGFNYLKELYLSKSMQLLGDLPFFSSFVMSYRSSDCLFLEVTHFLASTSQ